MAITANHAKRPFKLDLVKMWLALDDREKNVGIILLRILNSSIPKLSGWWTNNNCKCKNTIINTFAAETCLVCIYTLFNDDDIHLYCRPLIRSPGVTNTSVFVVTFFGSASLLQTWSIFCISFYLLLLSISVSFHSLKHLKLKLNKKSKDISLDYFFETKTP